LDLGKWVRVPNPDAILLPPNLRHSRQNRPGADRLPRQRDPVLERHAQQRRGRHEHLAGVGAAVRELAMRAVHPAPLLDQIEDLPLLPGQQPVHRAATGIAIRLRPCLPQPLSPAVRAHVGDVKHPAAPRVRPSVRDRSVDQPQQLELGLRAHARGTRAEKPERCLRPYLPRQIKATISRNRLSAVVTDAAMFFLQVAW
jgi:hypothetical protein